MHETIDGEAIVIDLETGAYFSLTGSAPEIWRLLIGGWTAQEIAEGFAEGDQAAVTSFVGELLAASLVTEDNAAATRQDADGPTGAWAPPVLQTYTDMEYFLLLDPVHDVQPAGWPHAKPEE